MKLEIKNLSVHLDDQPILRDVSLEVANGEFVSLLGPSGCGKTTMLKTIAGLLPVGAGEIFLGDQEVSRVPTHKRGAVVVFQDLRMFPHMTAAENVAFPLKMQGVPKKERLKIASEFLKKVHLEGRENQPVSKMSGGQQQRVALARALAAQPKLLLLDEPFSALDENLREDMRQLVKSLQRELGVTTLLVTHDRGEALSMSDRVALMFDGQLAQHDTPEAVYTRPATRQAADYFGDCVYLPGKVSDGQFGSPFVDLPTRLPDGDYDLMIRPSQLEVDCPGYLEATVTDLRYYGGEIAVELELAPGIRLRKAYARHPGWKAGQRIRCSIAVDHPVLFIKGERRNNHADHQHSRPGRTEPESSDFGL